MATVVPVTDDNEEPLGGCVQGRTFRRDEVFFNVADVTFGAAIHHDGIEYVFISHYGDKYVQYGRCLCILGCERVSRAGSPFEVGLEPCMDQNWCER